MVVVWEGDADLSVFGRRYDSTGNALGDAFRINTVAIIPDEAPVAIDNGGAFVVVWDGEGLVGDPDARLGVFGQRYDSLGAPVGSEFQLSDFTVSVPERGSFSSQFGPALGSSADGVFVVVWDSRYQDGHLGGIFGQRYSSTGDRLGTEFQVNSYTTGHQTDPSLAVTDEGFVVVWLAGRSPGVSGQRYSSAGTALGTEFQIDAFGNVHSATVAASLHGEFTVVTSSNTFQQHTPISRISGQRYSSTGDRLGTEFQINTSTTSNYEPSATIGPDGTLFVVWNTGPIQCAATPGFCYYVLGQRLDRLGTRIGSEFQAAEGHISEGGRGIAVGASGDVLLVYGTGTGEGIFARWFFVAP